MAAVRFKTQGPLAKAYSRLQWIGASFLEQQKNYGWGVSFPSLMWWVGNYGHSRAVGFWALPRLTRGMDRYFEQHYKDILQQYSGANRGGQQLDAVSDDSYPIWVFWWQGEAAMPELVRACYAWLTAHNACVTLITESNIRSYCHIPEAIYKKVAEGKISYTHLSDILRVALLAEHGGMWVDSTCFVPYAIPAEAKREVFYSPSTRGLPPLPMWSNSRWCGYNLGTCVPRHPLFLFLRDMLFAINQREACLPHYLILDYLLDYACRKLPALRAAIEGHTPYNAKRNALHFMLNKPYNAEDFRQLVAHDWLFKLSYKTPWKKEVDGHTTYYGAIVRPELMEAGR